MPLELGVWRIDGTPQEVAAVPLSLEGRLEELLAGDLSVASPDWMLIGRQVPTDHGGFVDLLAIDADGRLIVLELKRDKTPRDIVAQALDYGSWVRTIGDDEVPRIYERFRGKHLADAPAKSFDDAFRERFGVTDLPEELNAGHDLVIVASAFDPSTERVVGYLADEYGVRINALFFRVFRDDDREYLTRAWLREPAAADATVPRRAGGSGEWNGEVYVNFDRDYDWDHALKYGYIQAGGGDQYTGALRRLEPGERVWVRIPQEGYVGVGRVVAPAVPAPEFEVPSPGDTSVAITEVADVPANPFCTTPGEEDYLARVEWEQTVSRADAIHERGMIGNQNIVARPTSEKWNHTVDRLKVRLLNTAAAIHDRTPAG